MTQQTSATEKQIFIASCVTHSPNVFFEEYKNLIIEIANLLETKYSCKTHHSIKKEDSRLSYIEKHKTAQECYTKCVKDIKESKLLIAEISFPSIGIGQEIEIASQNQIPIIVLFKDFFNRESKKELVVSRMALGNPSIIHQIQYTSVNDALSKLDLFIKNNPNYFQ